MNYNRTLSIMKPSAVEKKVSGKIISMFEENGFQIIAQKKIKLSKEQASKFYEIHKDRPFFNSLVNFMVSGPIIVQVLAKDNAVTANRELMGATNPKEAKKGTIRELYGENIERNAVHGSDSDENAKIEIAFFFSECEIFDR